MVVCWTAGDAGLRRPTSEFAERALSFMLGVRWEARYCVGNNILVWHKTKSDGRDSKGEIT